MNARASLTSALVSLSLGCSLQLTEVTECETNAECRAGFGLTAVCGEAGYCEPLEFPARCGTFPETLLEDPDFSESTLFGLMVDRELEGDRRAERASTLAVDMANRQGGLNRDGDGKPFGLITCDYQTDLEGASGYRDGSSRLDAARSTSTFLVETLGLTAILGPTSSTETEVVYVEVARPAGTLLLSPGADSTLLGQLDAADAGLLWRTIPSEDSVVQEMVRSIQARAVGNVFIVAQEGVGGASASLLQTLMTEQISTDLQTTVRYFQPEGLDLVAAINEAAGSGAQEVVFLGDHPIDAVAFLEVAAGDERFAEKTLLFGTAADDPAILAADAAGAFGSKTVEGFPPTYRVRVARPSPANSVTTSNFRNHYRAEYGNEDPLLFPVAPAAWDATWMLLLASASPDSTQSVLGGVGTLGLGLRALADPRVTSVTSLDPSNWRVAQESLRSGRTLNIEGASGALDYDPFSEELPGTAEIDVIELLGGNWEFAAEPVPAPPMVE